MYTPRGLGMPFLPFVREALFSDAPAPAPSPTFVTAPAPSPSSVPSVVVQNPDGTLTSIPLTASNLPPDAPQLLAPLEDDPGGTSGFLSDRATRAGIDAGDSQGREKLILAGLGALFLFAFLSGDKKR